MTVLLLVTTALGLGLVVFLGVAVGVALAVARLLGQPAAGDVGELRARLAEAVVPAVRAGAGRARAQTAPVLERLARRRLTSA